MLVGGVLADLEVFLSLGFDYGTIEMRSSSPRSLHMLSVTFQMTKSGVSLGK